MATGYRQRRRAARRSAQVWGWVAVGAFAALNAVGLGLILGAIAFGAARGWGWV